LTIDYFFSFDKFNYVRNNKSQDCIFCKIIHKDPDITDLSIYEGELFITSLNLYPYNPGHLLIFPKKHIEDVRKYSQKQETRLNQLIHYFLNIIDKTHKPTGYNIGYNMGLSAGASIKHLHLHIIPRYPSEIGIVDLVAGKRVLIENPRDTAHKIKKAITQFPFSISIT